jgi:hypothetical protein
MVHITVKLPHIFGFLVTKSSKSSHLPFMGVIEAAMFVRVAQAHWYAKFSS